MPRRTKLTPETQAQIVEAILKGATFKVAAHSAGIGERTLYDWLEQKPQFSQALRAAEAMAALRWLTVIDEAAPMDWRAAAWKLEHRYPEEYGRTIQEQHGEQRLTVVYEHDWRRVRLGAGEVVALPSPERDGDESEAAG